MPSERIQRQIDHHLDEIEEARVSGDWLAVQAKAEEILDLDPANEDAGAFLSAADRRLQRLGAAIGARASAPAPSPSDSAAPALPASFASGRYQVRKFLGEGGKKKVYLAHHTLLDRDVAFALIKTAGLDLVGRERITREA